MARYTPSPLFIDFTGKIGNSVFAANKGGNYLRDYTIPANPQTDRQVSARSLFRTASAAWYSLTDADRAQWNSFASESFNPLNPKDDGYTGRQAFMSWYNSCIAGNNFVDLGTEANGGIYINGGSKIVPSTYEDYVAPTVPVDATMDNKLHIKTSTDLSTDITSLTLVNVSGSPAKLKLTLNVAAGITGTAAANTITFGGTYDGGKHGGCKLYLSDRIKAGSTAYGNAFRSVGIQLPNAIVFTNTATALTALGVELAITSPYVITAGDYMSTLVFVSKAGQQQVVLQSKITIS